MRERDVFPCGNVSSLRGGKDHWDRVIPTILIFLTIGGAADASKWVRVPQDCPTIVQGLAALEPQGGTLYLSGGPYDEYIWIAPGNGFETSATLTIQGDGQAVWKGGISADWNLGSLTIRGVHFIKNEPPSGGWGEAGFSIATGHQREAFFTVEDCVFGDYSFVSSQGVSDVIVRDCRFDWGQTSSMMVNCQGFVRLTCSGCDMTAQGAPSIQIYSLTSRHIPGDVVVNFTGNRLVGTPADASWNLDLRADVNEMTVTGNFMPQAHARFDGFQQGRHGAVQIMGNRFHSAQIAPYYSDSRYDLDIHDNVFGVESPSSEKLSYSVSFYSPNALTSYNIHNNTFLGLGGYGYGQVSLSSSNLIAPASRYSFHENNCQCGWLYIGFPDQLDLTGNYWADSRGPRVPLNESVGCGISWNAPTPAPRWSPYMTGPASVSIQDYAGSQKDNAALTAILEANPDHGYAPLLAHLQADARGGKAPYGFHWIIDGEALTSTTASMDWLFESVGQHVVRLVVTDASGAVASDNATIDTRQGVGAIWGFVRDKDTAKPLAAATVTLRNASGQIVRSTTVDASGSYTFENAPLGVYSLSAEAPEHERQERAAKLERPEQIVRADFSLALPLGLDRLGVKEDLIARLVDFPKVEGFLVGYAAKPYAQTELSVAQWLDRQTSVTEALQRLELSELAVKDAGEQALMLSDRASGYYAALVSQAIDAVSSLVEVDKILQRYLMGGPQGLGRRIVGWVHNFQSRLLSAVLKHISSQLNTPRARSLVLTCIKAQIDEWVGKSELLESLKLENAVGQAIQLRLLDEYGKATLPLLQRSFGVAQNDGPYGLPLDDSKALMRYEMAAARAKTQTALSLTDNTSLVSDLADMIKSTLDFSAEVVRYSFFLLPLKQVFERLSMMAQAMQVYVTAVNAGACCDRLLDGLPADLSRATAKAFGHLNWNELIEEPSPGVGAPGWTSRYGAAAFTVPTGMLSVDLPTTDAVENALAACRALALANDFSGLSAAVENQLLPALETFDAKAARSDDVAALARGMSSGAYQQATVSLESQMGSEMVFLMAALDFIVRGQQAPDLSDPDYLAARGRYVARLDAVALAHEELVLALIQALEGAGTIQAPVTVVARNVFFASGGERADTITTSPCMFVLTAIVENLTSAPAQGVAVAVELPTTSGLALSGSLTTQTVGTLAANSTATVTWSLTYSGPIVDHVEYALVTIESENPTTPAFAAGAPALVLLGAAPFMDADLDGMSDAWETAKGLDATTSSDAALDPDGDGLSNALEFVLGTDPARTDTDGDGLRDDVEWKNGLDPTVADATADADADGLTNAQEIAADSNCHNPDTDGDGFSDGLEFLAGSNPTDAASTPTTASLVMGVRQWLLQQWQGMLADAFHLDTDRNGAVEISDLVKLLATP